MSGVIPVVLLLYPLMCISLKVLLKTDTRCSRWLKAIADRMTVRESHADSDAERTANVSDVGNLPERLVNPLDYRELSQGAEELQGLIQNRCSANNDGI